MTLALKAKLAIGALAIAALSYLDGMMLLCYCPGPFVFAVPFALAGVVLSSRWPIRAIGIFLCAASIAMAVHQSERKQALDAKIKATQIKANEMKAGTIHSPLSRDLSEQDCDSITWLEWRNEGPVRLNLGVMLRRSA